MTLDSRPHPRGSALSRIALIAALALAPVALPGQPVPVAAADSDHLPSFAPMIDRVLPAVVNISVVQHAGHDTAEAGNDDDNGDDQAGPPEQNGPRTPFDDFLRRFFEQQQQGRHGHVGPAPKVMSLGSGFIIDPTGYVVTNNHVVGDADEVTVIFHDDSKHPAKIIGKDQRTDLALLKIETSEPLPYVKFGDSDKSRVGDWVIAVGNPFGLGGTVTKGIISARGRPVENQSYVDFLQVDASINRGNSGGPTFNLDGEVIGINTAIFSPNGGSVGIGFAIPSNAAKPVLDALKASGHVDRGWLGVQIQPVTPEIASSLGMDEKHPKGALVAAVTDASPAAKAGVKLGDVIQKFNGKTVEAPRDLQREVAETAIGKTVDIEVLRAGQTLTLHAVTAKLDDAKDNETPSDQPSQTPEKQNKVSALGLTLSTLTDDARKRLNLPKEVGGVLVSHVKEGSPAADHGIQSGDVIAQVNGQPVGDPKDVVQQVKALKPGEKKSILLLINRQGTNRFIALAPAEKQD